MPRSRPQRSSCKSRSRTRLDLDRDCFHALPCRRDPASVVAGRDSNPRPSGYEPAEVNRIPARSHCPFLVLTPGISAQFLEADLDMSRANTGRFAGVFGMACEREQLLAMQKVEGSNPFSRFRRKPRYGGVFCVPGLVALHASTSIGSAFVPIGAQSDAPTRPSTAAPWSVLLAITFA